MTCQSCRESTRLDFEFSMAFQPIYDAVAERIWGYEALVRGTAGEGAFTILSQVSAEQKYRFDQDCRVKAIELASRLFPTGEDLKLSINFMPNAVYEPAACLRATLQAADRYAFPKSSIATVKPCLRYSAMMLVRWTVSETFSSSVNSNMMAGLGNENRSAARSVARRHAAGS